MAKFLRVFSPLAIGMLLFFTVGCTSTRSTSHSIGKIADWFETESLEQGPGEAPTVAVLVGPGQFRLLPPGSLAIGDPVPLGSVTKVVTALMALQCVESGLFNLDDPAPGVVHSTGESVTWRHLLEHRAGYVDRRVDPTSLEASIPVIPPGVLSLYSNEGYVVLARSLESASGMSFPQLARTLVFDPLEMTEVNFQVRVENDPWSPSLGASGLIASPQAFSPLVEAIAVQDGRLLRRGGWGELFGLELWEQVSLEGRGALVQEGRVTGQRSALLVFPKRRSALLVTYNEMNLSPLDSGSTERANRLQRRMIEELGEKQSGAPLAGLRLPQWISGKPSCSACDWTDRWGVYRSHMTGETLIIDDDNGGPVLIEESGETLAVGPPLSDGRRIFHDLYKPITDVAEEEMLQTWPRRSGVKDTIEFGSRDGGIVGFLRGSQWYGRVEP